MEAYATRSPPSIHSATKPAWVVTFFGAVPGKHAMSAMAAGRIAHRKTHGGILGTTAPLKCDDISARARPAIKEWKRLWEWYIEPMYPSRGFASWGTIEPHATVKTTT